MEHITEIQNLIEMIERANNIILIHQQTEFPDENSISNYERLKMQYFEQLAEIFNQMNISLKLTA